MRSWSVRAGVLVAAVLAAAPLLAQSTVTLNVPGTQVTGTTIRGGSYATTNYVGQPLVTKAHGNATYVRRALIKFDTETTIAAGSTVTAAKLTLTVKAGGGADAARTIAAYQVTSSFAQAEATWNNRKAAIAWVSSGGDLGTKIATASVGNVAGAKVTFDVTRLVQAAVSGSLGTSRYTRIALVDSGAASDGAMRVFASMSDTNAAIRPVLSVTVGAAAPAPTTPTTPSTIRVLQYNTHHGGWGTDGVWDVARLIASAAKTKPDIISLNEVERNTSWSKGGDDLPLFLAAIKTATGQTWYGVFVVGSGASTGIGNAILSRTPIIAHSTHQLSQGRAVIHVQIAWNGRTINFFSTHTDANSSSYRLTQIGEIKAYAAGFPENRIIAGDFNSSQGSAEWTSMTQSYVDAWKASYDAGTSIAYPGNTGGMTRNGRIDFIWTSKGANQLVLKDAQVFDTRDASGIQPSDHRPVMAVFTVQ